MAEQRYVKYGDREMPLEPGMTLEQAKELMARHFPELANPKVETKKTGEKTVYVFSKQAGHKGADGDVTAIRKRLARAKPQTLPVVLQRLLADPDDAVNIALTSAESNQVERIASEWEKEAREVESMREKLQALPVDRRVVSGSIL